MSSARLNDTHDERDARLALVAAGVTVVLWASAFVAIRSAGKYFSPGALALGRLLCGSIVLGLVAWRRGEGWPKRPAWQGILLSGALWFGAYMVALNWGEQKIDAGTAAMVVSLGPVLIAVLSGLLLSEGFPPRLLAGLAVSLIGVAVVGVTASGATHAGAAPGGAAASGTGHAGVAGVLLCVVAAVTFAGAVVSQKPALRSASALQVTTFGALVGTVLCLPFSGQLVHEVGPAPLSATLSICYLGIFPTAIGFTTWAYALARTPAGKMGATTYLVPAITVLLSWAVLSQVPTGFGAMGGVFCLAGVALSRRRGRLWPRLRQAPSALTGAPRAREHVAHR